MTLDTNHERGEEWTEVLSQEPRAVLYHNFLSKEECEYLINLAKPHMAKSAVVDRKTGKGKVSSFRTSSGMSLRRGRDRVIKDIEKRIADCSNIPVENGENLQVLRYKTGQKYAPHHDYFSHELHTKNGDQRIATFLMYLSDVEEGGETAFPNAKGNFSSKGRLSIKPKMGNALLFWNVKPDDSLDPLSLHEACPVIRGEKWSATKWMHRYKYN